MAVLHRLVVVCLVGALCEPARAIGFDDDDFIVAGFNSDTIAVYDSGLVFKGYLDPAFESVAGLDFDAAGNHVAAGRTPSQMRSYDNAGLQVGGFAHAAVGAPLDVTVSPSGNYIVAPQGTAAEEFSPAGAKLRSFGNASYDGVAVLPGNVLWAGTSSAPVFFDIFDLTSGAKTGTVLLDNGQGSSGGMFYSTQTNTVLFAANDEGAVFERDLNGGFVRSFAAPGFGGSFGAIRGPSGDVFATDFFDNGVYRWTADGTFVGFTSLSATTTGPMNILWTGNIPEPTGLALLALGALAGVARRRRRACP